MGALARATKQEVERLVSSDPDWWPGVLAHIAERGSLSEIAHGQAWSWGALWAWIQADEARVGEYDAALKARAQGLAFEAIDEIDSASMEDVPLRKFKVDAKLRIAGKWDRGRYGESAELKHSGGIGLSLMAVLASLPRAGMPDEKVVFEEAKFPGIDAPTDAQLANTIKSGFVANYVEDEI